MKTNIHPKYYSDAIVTCACGNIFTTGSTQKEITVEVCAKCHPFFTGEMKYVDTLGRVDRFKRKQRKAQKLKKQKAQAKKKKVKDEEREPMTLKEMLKAIR